MIVSVEVTEYEDHDVHALWLAARTAAQDTASGALADVVHRFPAAGRFAGMELAAPPAPVMSATPWKQQRNYDAREGTE